LASKIGSPRGVPSAVARGRPQATTIWPPPSGVRWEDDDMLFSARPILRAAAAASLCALSGALTLGAAQAQQQTFVMKITTPTIHAAPDQYARNFAAAVEKDSGGRIKGEVYPASQLGSIPRQIEGTQFGSIQAAVIPPEFFVGVDQRFEVLAAPGLATP